MQLSLTFELTDSRSSRITPTFTETLVFCPITNKILDDREKTIKEEKTKVDVLIFFFIVFVPLIPKLSEDFHLTVYIGNTWLRYMIVVNCY